MVNKRYEVINDLVDASEKYGLPAVLSYVFGKNIKLRLYFKTSECEKSIDELSLSVRSQNALKRAHIDNLDMLIDRLNEGNLKSIRNLGKKSYSEIQTKILVYGYENLNKDEKERFFENLIAIN